MFPSKLATVIMLAVFVCLPSQAIGQRSSTAVYAPLYIGIGFPMGDIGQGTASIEAGTLSPAPALGAGLGVRLVSGLAIEGFFTYMPTTLQYSTDDLESGFSLGTSTNIIVFGGNISYFFQSGKTSLIPFVTAGAGGISYSADLDQANSSSSDFMFDLGAGLEVPISEKINLRYALNDYIGSTAWDPILTSGEATSKNTQHNIVLSGGMTFFF